MGFAVLIGSSLMIASSISAAVPAVTPEIALQKYCEPLIAGSTAKQVGDIARQDGFKDEVVSGQPMLQAGELLIGISETPRVCFVQALTAMSFEDGVALVDAWAKRHPDAVQSPTTRGPDGAQVRGWSAPARRMAIVASQQRAPSGRVSVAFILMPLPS